MSGWKAAAGAVAAVAGLVGLVDGQAVPAAGLQAQLIAEGADALARAARQQGDAARGAVVLYQPHLTCTKCHALGDEGPRLGPDLARAGKEAIGVYLVESLLTPSKVIKKGYETVAITTTKGKTVTGLLAEEKADRVVLRDPAGDGKLIEVARRDIDERSTSGRSVMPEGLVNLLGGRQEFLDLVRYLMEVAEGGPERAQQLRPSPSLYAPPPLPEYEHRIDHAGFIVGFDRAAFERGEAVYARVCVNCHGTRDQPGSLPTSLRFASGAFKNGSDPYRMYQTLTHGYGMMTPQAWMAPEQKYDVIHYIREAYLKPHNPGQYAAVDRAYLDSLPKGDTRGPKPSLIQPWSAMDYGNSLMATVEVAKDRGTIAAKGIAVRLDAGPGGVSRGRHWMLYDHDTLRMAGAWTGEGFIDWHGINFDGGHGTHPRTVGQVLAALPGGPGWADPESGSFADPRPRARDGRPYGPLPRAWGRYRGLYHYGSQAVVAYTVGTAAVLEMPGYERLPGAEGQERIALTRTLTVGPSAKELAARVATPGTATALVGGGPARLEERDGFTVLTVPARDRTVSVRVLIGGGTAEELQALAAKLPSPGSLEPFTRGGPRRWPDLLRTRVARGGDAQAFAVDTFGLPVGNPWSCQLRLTGFDFLPGGRELAVCTWDGDVWRVAGIGDPSGELTWQRIASGLFQPLGLKVRDGRIFVCCRDQIAVLDDLNGDGEADFVECFNSDHQVTEHFHEFAMDLQTDAAGNFYYAKGARHALPALVPQHGTLLKVSRDGSRTEILANGFRAPNGVCLNPDGTCFLTDQEGHWTPKNRINWVRPGGFYGNFWGYHDLTDRSDAAMKPPVCWITNAFDRSPSELVWVDGAAWGPLQGSLLNFSYGYGKVYVVPHEKVGDELQGGMCALPLPQFPTGVMRGRFHPGDGQLYTCGMFAWAGNQTAPGGFYRVRMTGKPVCLPVGLSARQDGLHVTFSGPVDVKTAGDLTRYGVKVWGLKRSERYGSDHIDEHPLKVTGAEVSADGRSVTLRVADLAPTWCMEIKYRLKAADGEEFEGLIHNTIHRLRE